MNFENKLELIAKYTQDCLFQISDFDSKLCNYVIISKFFTFVYYLCIILIINFNLT